MFLHTRLGQMDNKIREPEARIGELEAQLEVLTEGETSEYSMTQRMDDINDNIQALCRKLNEQANREANDPPEIHTCSACGTQFSAGHYPEECVDALAARVRELELDRAALVSKLRELQAVPCRKQGCEDRRVAQAALVGRVVAPIFALSQADWDDCTVKRHGQLIAAARAWWEKQG